MERSSFLHNLTDQLKTWAKRSYRYLRSLLGNGYFWGGLTGLLGVLLVLYLLFNHLIMPTYTRYQVTVRVPDVRNQSLEDARQILAERGLGVGKAEQRFDRDRQPNVILDQSPPPEAAVKPGRLIYVTINSGEIPMVKIPRVEGMSLREARNRLLAQGLTIEAERADSIPSPYNNTVTRQHPPAGETVPEESGITLWYSRGLGDRYVVLPDVTGMTISEARRALLRRRLRAVVLDRSEEVEDPVVVRQSREPGTRVREGFELRLFTKEE